MDENLLARMEEAQAVMKIFKLVALVAVIGSAGCGGGGDESEGNVCDYIIGQSYSSLEVRECGAGIPPCNGL